MFRPMRRKKQQLSEEETIKVLERGTSGVLSLMGDEDYPYGVPLSYVYDNGKIYFHCAKEGHKIDAIKNHAKASFCVIDQDKIVKEKFTTYFRSAIAFGHARILTDEREIRASIQVLSDKYCTNMEEESKQEIEHAFHRLCMVELDIDYMTGKEAIELTR